MGRVERAVRSATRKKAKARAYRLYATARGLVDTTWTERKRRVGGYGLPDAPKAPDACPGCGRPNREVPLSWNRADGRGWLCDGCRAAAAKPSQPVVEGAAQVSSMLPILPPLNHEVQS